MQSSASDSSAHVALQVFGCFCAIITHLDETLRTVCTFNSSQLRNSAPSSRPDRVSDGLACQRLGFVTWVPSRPRQPLLAWQEEVSAISVRRPAELFISTKTALASLTLTSVALSLCLGWWKRVSLSHSAAHLVCSSGSQALSKKLKGQLGEVGLLDAILIALLTPHP